MLSDSISARTLALLFLYNNSLQNFVSPQSIWIFHSSLFVFHLICHIRQNIILAVFLRQFPTKFCITTKHLDFSLFTFRFSLNLSYPTEHYPCSFSTTIPYKILHHHKAFGFFTLHFSFFTYTCIAYTTKQISCGFITMTESTRYLF